MDDELDQLIESSVNFDEEVAEPPADDEAPDESNAMDDAAADDDVEGEEAAPEPDDAEAQDPDPDGTDDGPEEEDPRIAALTAHYEAKLQTRENLLTAIFKNAEEGREKERLAAIQREKDADYEAKLAKWAEMDPDEARQEQVRYLAEQAQEREQTLQAQISELQERISASEQEKIEQQQQANIAQLRSDTIDYLKAEYKLTAAEVEDMSGYNDPYVMEAFAQRKLAARQNQTSAAREARRQELEGNPALRGGETGSGTPTPKKDAANLDDFVDGLTLW